MNKILWRPSPFYESRGNYPLDMIVIHHIGSKDGKLYGIGGTITWFTSEEAHRNPVTKIVENRVSAHYAIPRQPYKEFDSIYFVNETDIAYHAGDSQWIVNGKLRRYINRYSVGIELEGDGNLVEYTDYQYSVLIELVKKIASMYKIPESNIVGHEDIAPQRKVDPGKLFDWMRLRKGIASPVIVNIPDSAPVDNTPPVSAPVVSTPVSVPTVSPIPQPVLPPVSVPDSEFHMGSGVDKDGKRPGFFDITLKWLLGIFSK